MATSDRPVGLLVVRTWHEGNRFRARVSYTADIAGGAPTMQLFAESEHVRSIMILWLDEVSAPVVEEGDDDSEP